MKVGAGSSNTAIKNGDRPRLTDKTSSDLQHCKRGLGNVNLSVLGRDHRIQ